MKIKKSQIFTTPITVEKFIPGGQALATLENGKKLFLWNALPGEQITEITVIKQKSHYEEGIATKFSKISPYRVEPRDSHFLSTSPWQILDYSYELSQKSLLVQEMFKEQGIIIDTPKIITDGKDYFYRNKMEYSLYWDNKESKISLAFHSRGSHVKIPIEYSSIERPEILESAQKIVSKLNESHAEARNYQSLLLRTSQDGTVSGGLYENHKPHPTFSPLSDTILDHSYTYSPNGFFQINLPVYELALKEMQSHITDSEPLLDLYSGVGTIGLSIAKPSQPLTLVECDPYCFEEMKKNCQNRPHATPVLAKSEEALDYISPSVTTILDPPRAGCDKKLLEKLLEVTPEKVLYLSCNPITQARDIAILLEKYTITSIKAFNFFPHTPHIENLVILKKKEVI